jgi:nucleotide-binding universal stress UspA family protein
MTIRRILVPLTGHPEEAVMHRYSLYFATKTEAPVLGLYISGIKPFPTSCVSSTGGVDSPLVCNFMRTFQDRGITVDTCVTVGSWKDLLHEHTTDSLIALPYGKRFVLPDLLPENAVCLSRQVVLCCPDTYIDIESIALAYDGSENARKALHLAVWLSEKACWPLTVLMVAGSEDPNRQWMDDVETYLDTLTINSATVILSGTLDHALHRFMVEGSVELLIMGARGKHEKVDDHLGTNTAAMINQGRFPLLVVP